MSQSLEIDDSLDDDHGQVKYELTICWPLGRYQQYDRMRVPCEFPGIERESCEQEMPRVAV